MKTKLFTIIVTFSVMFLLGLAFGCSSTGDDDDVAQEDGGIIGDDDDAQTCLSDEDCPGDQKCIGALCTVIECTSNADCEGDLLCKDYKCVEKTIGKECTDNSECTGTGERCIVDESGEGHCTDAECLSNEDCPKGHSCNPDSYTCVEGIEEGSLCNDDTGCADNQTCYEGACKATCMSNADCEENEICEQTSFGKMVCMPDVECRSDSDCEDGEICEDNVCIEDTSCYTNEDCTEEGKGICNMSTGGCVECLTTPDCKSAVLVCDAVSHVCVDTSTNCKTDADCADPTRPVCDTTTGYCKPESTVIGCLSDADCTDASYPTCDTDTGRCVESGSKCTKDEDCTSPLKPYCNEAVGVCVASEDGCFNNSDCEDPKHVCNPKTGECVQCMGNFDCDAEFNCNLTYYQCVYSGSGTACSNDTICQETGDGMGCVTGTGKAPYGVQFCDADGNCQGASFIKMIEKGTCYCTKACVPEAPADCTSCGSRWGGGANCPAGFECSDQLGGVCQRYCGDSDDCVIPEAPSCIAGKCLCM